MQRPFFREEKNVVVNLLTPVHIIEHVIKNNGSASYRRRGEEMERDGERITADSIENPYFDPCGLMLKVPIVSFNLPLLHGRPATI